MKYTLLIAVILLSLIGCAITERGEDERQYDNDKPASYKRNVIEPAILAALSTCAYHFEYNKWPTVKHGEKTESITDYEMIATSPYAIKFRIPSAADLLKIEFVREEESCNYTVSVGKDDENVSYTVQDQVTEEIIDKIERNKPRELSKYVEKVINLKSSPYLVEDKEYEPEVSPFGQVVGQILAAMIEATLKVGICVLLGATNCN